MDAIWLILDSLSLSETPFVDSGPNTMHQFQELVDERGVMFEEAYAPGPLSPSSHASMFTGLLPSETGMHEAHPYFDGSCPTIADALADTHSTHLITPNSWLFQGLDVSFDTGSDFSRQYLVFRDASDPQTFSKRYSDDLSGLSYLRSFLDHSDRPLRSLVNLGSYRLSETRLTLDGDDYFRYADRINDRIRSRLSEPGDHFVVANYMDVHPPFNASDDAVAKFAPDVPKDELPVGAGSERHLQNAEKSYDVEWMQMLYRASIWDLDRTVTPLIRDLIDDDTFVIVLSDHGIWNSDTAYSENRLHVPLFVFSPDETPRRFPHTVNLNMLPSTTMKTLTGDSGQFRGDSLLEVSEDQLSVTEIVHHPNDVYSRTKRVDVTKSADRSGPVQRDLVLRRGDTQVTYIDGDWQPPEPNGPVTRELRKRGEKILSQPIQGTDTYDIERDEATEHRLRALGYK